MEFQAIVVTVVRTLTGVSMPCIDGSGGSEGVVGREGNDGGGTARLELTISGGKDRVAGVEGAGVNTKVEVEMEGGRSVGCGGAGCLLTCTEASLRAEHRRA